MRAQKVNTNSFDVLFFPKLNDFAILGENTIMEHKPVRLQKTNRFIVTRGNANEGILLKESIPHEHIKTTKKGKLVVNKEVVFEARLDAFGNPQRTELQKDKFVTLVNDIKGHTIENMHIDYNFYINECLLIIRDIKPYMEKRHKAKPVQKSLVLI